MHGMHAILKAAACTDNLCVLVQRQKASQEDMNTKVDALKTELGYWEDYLSSNVYIAGPDFTLAGGQTVVAGLCTTDLAFSLSNVVLS